MRRMISMLATVTVSVLLSAFSLMAAEADVANDAVRDECLLSAVKCEQSVDSIQMRIERLNNEISKGTDVYTVDELNVLKRKLEEINKHLDTIMSGG